MAFQTQEPIDKETTLKIYAQRVEKEVFCVFLVMHDSWCSVFRLVFA